MHRSLSITSPVITFLSGSPIASKKTHQLLCSSLFRMEDVPLYNYNSNNNCENLEEERSSNSRSFSPEQQQQRQRRRKRDIIVNLNEPDSLDNTIPSLLLPSRSSSKWRWQSLASRCTSTGAIIHILSMGPTRKSLATESKSDDFDDNDKQHQQERDDGTMSLLSITDDDDDEHYNETTTITTTSSKTNNAAAAVKKSRRILASHISPTIGTKLVLMNMMGFSINATDIFGGNNTSITPLIDTIPERRPIRSHNTSSSSGGTIHSVNSNENNNNDDDDDEQIVLRELVLPFSTDYQNNGSLPSRLSGAGLGRAIDSFTGRPVVGLYQWPDSSSSSSSSNTITSSSSSSSSPQNKKIIIRPLPAASEDKTLPPPSLIFQCSRLSIIDSHENNNNNSSNSSPLQINKIGFNGTGQSGQLRIHHANIPRNWDVRLCESKRLSSCFAEAEESLLAGSLSELQSVNVLAEGGGGGATTGRDVDEKMGVGDCWAEFRATVKNPWGYFKNWSFSGRSSTGGVMGKHKNGSSSSSTVRVAKAPNLPYE